MTIAMPELHSTGRAGQDYPELEPDTNLPVDRTICPRCLHLEPERFGCHVCHARPVCPTCRNARVLSVAAGRFPAYRVCPDCCEELQDANGRPMRSETGVPMWLLFPSRQQDAIRAYRAARWQTRKGAADDVPFD